MLKVCAFLVVASMGCLSLYAQDNKVRTVDPTEFKELLKSDTDSGILDVRKPEEYASGHLPNAMNIDWLDSVAFKTEAQKLDKNKTYYVYCRSGRRSAEAAKWLAERGYKVVELRGGWLAWDRCCAIKTDTASGCCD